MKCSLYEGIDNWILEPPCFSLYQLDHKRRDVCRLSYTDALYSALINFLCSCIFNYYNIMTNSDRVPVGIPTMEFSNLHQQ